jgi:putative endopeptidase
MNITRHSLPPLLLLLLQNAACATPVSGIDLASFDRSVRFQDDIYLASNGTWLTNARIPADSDSFSIFRQLRDSSELHSRELIEQAAQQTSPSAPIRKMVDLYRSFMDADRIEALGIAPLRPDLARIAAIGSQAGLVRELAALQSSAVNVPLQLMVEPAADNANAYLLQLRQGGLGLPDRDYYLGSDPRLVAARQAYTIYLQRLFSLAGFDRVDARVQNVLDLETRIALIQQDKVSNRDPHKTWSPLSPAQLQVAAPEIDWQAFLTVAGVPDQPRLNLQQRSYITQLASLTRAVPLAVWRDYLNARTLSAYAPFLNKSFVDASFAFAQQALAGINTPKPRWKDAVGVVENTMGETLGQLYVAKYFPPEAKTRMDTLVKNLMAAYRRSIDTQPWMSPATRTAAQQKLAKYRVKIGYPSRWRDYAALTIRADDLLGNIHRAMTFSYAEQINHLGKPVDKEEWQMTPQTVNAYYDPARNEIVFPAGILQPPFFNLQADDAVNYGAIGTIIGHEISHGFDDEGSQYDGDGNLRNWWSDQDRARFNALADRLVAQYSSYEALPGHFVNGRLTLGEDIADNAGLQIAFKAYRMSLGGRIAPVIDGLNGEQRFFIGFTQSWKNKITDSAALKLLVTDPHAPARFRPQGAVVNADAFYEAFDVKPGDKMYKAPSDRIRFW